MDGAEINPAKDSRSKELKPWETLQTREVLAAPPWITVSVQKVRLPNGRVVNDYHQIALPDYTVIFAETIDGSVIIERQYKHGVGKITLGLPAGSIEKDETALEAAQRELLEETGYVSDDWEALGDFAGNGNYGCGRAYMFRARQARLVAEPNSGDLEDMEILLIEKDELLANLRKGEIDLLATATAIVLAINGIANDSVDGGVDPNGRV